MPLAIDQSGFYLRTSYARFGSFSAVHRARHPLDSGQRPALFIMGQGFQQSIELDVFCCESFFFFLG